MAQAAPAVTTAPAPFLQDRHRRLLGLVRSLEASREEDERVEFVAELGEEVAELVALEDHVLAAPLAGRVPEQFGPGSQAAARRAALVSLAARLEATPAVGPSFASALGALATALTEHVRIAVRELLPALQSLAPAEATRLHAALVETKERLAEH